MSQEIGGYADWMGASIRRSASSDANTVVIPAGTTTGIIATKGSSFSSMFLELTVTVGRVRVRVEHNRSNPDASPFVTHFWYMRTTQVVKAIVPVISSYLGLSMRAATALDSTIVIRTQKLNSYLDKVHYVGESHEMSRFGFSAPPGTTSVFVHPYLLPGPATIWTEEPAAGSTIIWILDTYDENLAFLNRIWAQVFAGGVNFVHVQIPHTYWEFQVVNTGGVAQTVNFGITHQGELA